MAYTPHSQQRGRAFPSSAHARRRTGNGRVCACQLHVNLNLLLTHGSARTRAVGADQALREAALPCAAKL